MERLHYIPEHVLMLANKDAWVLSVRWRDSRSAGCILGQMILLQFVGVGGPRSKQGRE